MAIPYKLRKFFGGVNHYHVTISSNTNDYVGPYSPRYLYATQANLHAVISFLADSISQLPLNVYERSGEYDRKRDRDSAAAKLLRNPNPNQTSCELINSSVIEYYLYGLATWWLLPDANAPSGWQLRLIPHEWIQDTTNTHNFAPSKLTLINSSGSQLVLNENEFIQFKMYSPGNPSGYQSPISSLRQTLLEQIEADNYRTAVWRSSGRLNAWISRPKDVEPWTKEQRDAFATAFKETWAKGGENAGQVPILEDGMKLEPYVFNAKEAQYIESKQLSREDSAAAYHVNPSLIWHTSTQTYASARDNARALYADTLGPTIQMWQQRINSFLFPMIGAPSNRYCEFDLTEKLKGSFEERASILQSAVGGPWLTRDEARAEDNRPPLPDGQGQQVITPLNVTVGGLAAPNDTDPTIERYNRKSKEVKQAERIEIKARSDEEDENALEAVFAKYYKRQAASIIPKINSKAAPDWWNEKRWDRELADDLYPVFMDVTTKHGAIAGEALDWEYNPAQTEAYLQAMAEGKAKGVNSWTLKKIEKAIADGKPLDEVYKMLETSEAKRLGTTMATALASWATLEACSQYSYDTGENNITKTWIHSGSKDPRAEHVAMNGQTVPYDENFSNGMNFPGDELFGAEDTANCRCTVQVTVIKQER